MAEWFSIQKIEWYVFTMEKKSNISWFLRNASSKEKVKIRQIVETDYAELEQRLAALDKLTELAQEMGEYETPPFAEEKHS